MSYVTLYDRVPVETISVLTNAALQSYLERHGWEATDRFQHLNGTWITAYRRNDCHVTVPTCDGFTDHVLRMSEAISTIAVADNLRSADVIAELQHSSLGDAQ